MSLKLPIHATVSSPGGHRSHTRIGGPVSLLVTYYQVGTRSRLSQACEALTLTAALGGSLPCAVKGQRPAQTQTGSLTGHGGWVRWLLPLESPHPCGRLRSLEHLIRHFQGNHPQCSSSCQIQGQCEVRVHDMMAQCGKEEARPQAQWVRRIHGHWPEAAGTLVPMQPLLSSALSALLCGPSGICPLSGNSRGGRTKISPLAAGYLADPWRG